MKLTQDEIVVIQALIGREEEYCKRCDDEYHTKKCIELHNIYKKLTDEWVRLEK